MLLEKGTDPIGFACPYCGYLLLRVLVYACGARAGGASRGGSRRRTDGYYIIEGLVKIFDVPFVVGIGGCFLLPHRGLVSVAVRRCDGKE